MTARRRGKKLSEMKSWQLCVLWAPAMLGSALVAYLFKGALPLYVKSMETKEIFSWLGLFVSGELVAIALLGVMFAALGKRCSELLYQRHLD